MHTFQFFLLYTQSCLITFISATLPYINLNLGKKEKFATLQFHSMLTAHEFENTAIEYMYTHNYAEICINKYTCV